MCVTRCFVVSDLHLGSAYFHHRHFSSWLDTLPKGVPLVLNGDVIDRPGQALPDAHRAVLERLVGESQSRPVIWVYGNRDAEFKLADSGQIRFVDSWRLDRRLLVIHGHRLDRLMPRHSAFKWVFRRFHRCRIWLGGRDAHVAEYAKKWPLLYRVLNEHVARNALRVAQQEGVEAVVCGHTHAAMAIERQGRRYFNTGAWTEKPFHFLEVAPDRMALHTYEDDRDCD